MAQNELLVRIVSRTGEERLIEVVPGGTDKVEPGDQVFLIGEKAGEAQFVQDGNDLNVKLTSGEIFTLEDYFEHVPTGIDGLTQVTDAAAVATYVAAAAAAPYSTEASPESLVAQNELLVRIVSRTGEERLIEVVPGGTDKVEPGDQVFLIGEKAGEAQFVQDGNDLNVKLASGEIFTLEDYFEHVPTGIDGLTLVTDAAEVATYVAAAAAAPGSAEAAPESLVELGQALPTDLTGEGIQPFWATDPDIIVSEGGWDPLPGLPGPDGTDFLFADEIAPAPPAPAPPAPAPAPPAAIPPGNSPPSAADLDGDSVYENQPPGILVGTLSATDPEGDPLTYTLDGVTWIDPNTSLPVDVSAEFSLIYDPVGDVWQIFANNSMDYEQWYIPPPGDPDGGVEPTFIAAITVSDDAGNSTPGDVIINLLDVAESPEDLEFLPVEDAAGVGPPVPAASPLTGYVDFDPIGAPIFDVDEVVDPLTDPRVVDGQYLYIGDLNQLGDDDVKSFFTQYIYSKQEYPDEVAVSFNGGPEPADNEIFIVAETGEVYINLNEIDWDYEEGLYPPSGLTFVTLDVENGNGEPPVYYLAAQVDDHYLFADPTLLPSNLPPGAIYVDDTVDGEFHYLVLDTFGFRIADVNEAPEFLMEGDSRSIPVVDNDDSFYFQLSENMYPNTSLGFTPAWDVDGDTLLYGFWDGAVFSATSSDNLFAIDQGTGEITANNVMFDYENPADGPPSIPEGIYNYEIRVYDRDPITDPEALFDEAAVEIELLDVNEAPEFLSGEDVTGFPYIVNNDAYYFSVDENSVYPTAPVGAVAIAAFDPDGQGPLTPPDPGWYDLRFVFYDAGEHDTSPDGLFYIDPNTGVIMVAPTVTEGQIDFETTSPNPLTYTIRVYDDGNPDLYDEATVDITINDVNEAPEFTSHDQVPGTEESDDWFNLNVYENDPASLGDPNELGTLTAYDVDGDSPLYFGFWYGDDFHGSSQDGLFSINATTGEVSTATVFDYENPADGPPSIPDGVYTYDVRVYDRDPTAVSPDPDMLFDEAVLNITLHDVNEAPEFLSGSDTPGFPVVDNADAYYFSVDENSTAGASLSGTPAIGAFDPDGQGPLTAPAAGWYDLRYVFYDGGESDTSSDGLFYIDPNSGVITVATGVAEGDIDYETITPNPLTYNIRVYDDGNPDLYDEATVDITINDVNEPPEFTGEEVNDMDNFYFYLVENTAASMGDPHELGNLTADDVDGDTPLYFGFYWGGDFHGTSQDGLFSIDATTGEVSTATVFDFENPAAGPPSIPDGVYSYDVRVYDRDPTAVSPDPEMLYDEGVLNITLQDENEAPEFVSHDGVPEPLYSAGDFYNFTLAENNAVDATVPDSEADIDAFDPDGAGPLNAPNFDDTMNYWFWDGGVASGTSSDGKFDIDQASGKITANESFDYEALTTPTFTYEIAVFDRDPYTDPDAEFDTATVNIEITDEAEYRAMVLRGVDTGDLAGFSVSYADVNNDGITDVIIGAPGADGMDIDYTVEEGYWYFGGATPDDTDEWVWGNGVWSGGSFLGWDYSIYNPTYPWLVEMTDNDGVREIGSWENFLTSYWYDYYQDVPDYYVTADDPYGIWDDTHTTYSPTFETATELLAAGYSAEHAIPIYGEDGANMNSGEVYVVYGSEEWQGHITGFELEVLGMSGFEDYGFRVVHSGIGDHGEEGSIRAHIGWDVSYAGDVNGDGIDDFIIGGPRDGYLDDDGGCGVCCTTKCHDEDDRPGAAYVVFGKSHTEGGLAPIVDLALLDGTNGFRIDGEAEFDYLGWSVMSAGDFNGDGFGDVIVGAPGVGDVHGTAYIVWGGDSGYPAWGGGVLDIEQAVSDGDAFALTNTGSSNSDDHQGWSVGAIDINPDDGISELLVAGHTDSGTGIVDETQGSVFVVFSENASGDKTYDYDSDNEADLIDLWYDGYAFRIGGDDHGDKFGYSVAGAGDFDGDGLEDIIVGAPNDDTSGNSFSGVGSAYVVYGKAITNVGTTEDRTLDVGDLDGTNGFQIVGGDHETGHNDSGDLTGFSVSAAGDINGDGLDDILVGAPGGDNPYETGSDNSGETYLIFGGNPYEEGTQEYEDWVALHPDHDGHTGSFADGTMDVYELLEAGGGDGSDGVVIFGDANDDGDLTDNPTLGEGYDVDSRTSGFDVSAAGDFDGDGADDLIISSPDVNNPNTHEDGASGSGEGLPSGDHTGETYVVFGGDEWGSEAEVHIEDLLDPVDLIIEP